MNKALLIGNIAGDLELRYTSIQKPVLNFSIATQSNDEVEFHRIVVFNALAVAMSYQLAKGDKTMIEGYVRTRKWSDKQGVIRSSTEVVACSFMLFNSKKPG